MTVETTPPPVSSLAMPAFGDNGHQLVAINDAALLVDDDDTVSVTVERDADVGAHFAHFLCERFWRCRATLQLKLTPFGSGCRF